MTYYAKDKDGNFIEDEDGLIELEDTTCDDCGCNVTYEPCPYGTTFLVLCSMEYPNNNRSMFCKKDKA